jgi:hypothetical protein
VQDRKELAEELGLFTALYIMGLIWPKGALQHHAGLQLLFWLDLLLQSLSMFSTI